MSLHKRCAVMLALGLALAAPTVVAARPPAAAPVVIPLRPYLGVLPSLQLDIGGRPHTFLLDTAGGLTVVTPQLAGAIHCQPWGQVTGYRMRGERLDLARCDGLHPRLGDVDLRVPTAGVWDLSKILPKDAPPLAGSLAMDAFAGRVLTLDLAGHRLVLETPASLRARIRHAVAVPVRFSRDAQGLALTPLVAVQTPKGRLWMELDCGSDGTVIVNRRVAAALQLDPAHKGAQKLAMTLAGGIPLTANARVDDLIVDGDIGAPVLRQWIVTLDLGHQRLWIGTNLGAKVAAGRRRGKGDRMAKTP